MQDSVATGSLNSTWEPSRAADDAPASLPPRPVSLEDNRGLMPHPQKPWWNIFHVGSPSPLPPTPRQEELEMFFPPKVLD